MVELLKDVLGIFEQFGPLIGSAIVLFFGFHAFIYLLYKRHMDNVCAERDRLAAENLEYRTHLMQLNNKTFDIMMKRMK